MSGRTLICFVASMIVARSLGVANYGIYAALGSLIVLLIKCSNIGISAIFNTYIPRLKSSSQAGACSYIVRKFLFIRTIILFIVIGLLHILADPLILFIGEPLIRDYLFLVSIWYLVRGIMDGFLYVVWANMNMKFYTLVEISVSVFQLVATMILMAVGMTIGQLVLLMIMVNLIQLVCYGMDTISTIKPEPERTDLAPILKFGMRIWISDILLYFRDKSIDVFMILYFLKDTKAVAYYDIAYLIAIYGGLVLFGVIEKLSLPILSEAHARFGLEGLRKAWEFLTKLAIYLVAPVFVFFAAHSETVIRVFYSNLYDKASSLLVVFSVLTLLGAFLGNRISGMILLPLHKETLYLYLNGFNGALNIVLNLILIPRLGIMGAVISTGGSTLLTNLIELTLALKYMSARIPVAFIFRITVIMMLSISWTLLFKDLNLIGLVSVAIGYAVMVTLLLLKFYHFSDREKEIVEELSPGVFNFLSRNNLLR